MTHVLTRPTNKRYTLTFNDISLSSFSFIKLHLFLRLSFAQDLQLHSDFRTNQLMCVSVCRWLCLLFYASNNQPQVQRISAAVTCFHFCLLFMREPYKQTNTVNNGGAS